MSADCSWPCANQRLEIFLEEIQQAVLVDGLTFHYGPADIDSSLGRNTPHTASYSLRSHEEYMGEILFHRSTRFREHELANIEGLLTTLVYPLRNAMRYQDALQAAFRDPLTGAGNRVALEKSLMSWPNSSLTCLKWSRSIIRIDSGWS